MWIHTRASSAAFALLVASFTGVGAIRAQSSYGGQQPFDTEYLEPFAEPVDESSVPRLRFSLAAEIPLPGPLPGGGPRLIDGEIEIPVTGGVAQSGWAADSTPRLTQSDPRAGGKELEGTLWAVTPDGRFRVGVMETGQILMQKRCGRCVKGWRKKWKLRVSGRASAPPLITDTRVFFGATDNRVYGLKRKNGHRVWEANVEGRASRRLELWRPPRGGIGQPPVESALEINLEVLLVVPDEGAGLIALDARTGTRVATFAVPEDGGTLVGPPLVTPDGKIVVARQNYSPADAALMVFDLELPPEPARPVDTEQPAEPVRSVL
jgi:hypothetical protein